MAQAHEINKGFSNLNESKIEFARQIWDCSQKLKARWLEMSRGKIKRHVIHLKDPRAPKTFLKITMWREDDHIYTNISGNEKDVWDVCAKLRKQEEDMRERGLWDKSNPMQEYARHTWLLEVYCLIKYGLDLRNSNGEWATPGTEDFKKYGWIMDRDEFAMKYKCTPLMESRNMSDPFNKIIVGV